MSQESEANAKAARQLGMVQLSRLSPLPQRNGATTMDKRLTYSERAMVMMVEVNASAMTTSFLIASWRNSFNMAIDANLSPSQRIVWRDIRDVYAAELDKRDGIGVSESEARVLDGNR